QVDQDVVGVQVEEVVAGRSQQLLTLLHRGQPDRLDALDAERLDDGLPALHTRSIRAGPIPPWPCRPGDTPGSPACAIIHRMQNWESLGGELASTPAVTSWAA